MRDFTVKKGVQGYVVMIGCQVAGFSTAADLLVSIGEYVNDPEGTEKKYYVQPGPPAGIIGGCGIGYDNQVTTAPRETQGAYASLQAGYAR